MGQQNQPSDQLEKIELLDMPMEILEEILFHLADDDKDLLTASHVCKSFAAAAETAFARRYASKKYYIHFFGTAGKARESKLSFYKTMLSKYGGKIKNLYIFCDEGHIANVVEQSCGNLKQVHLIGVRNLNRETFSKFINTNRQLHALEIESIDTDLLDILDGRLNELKTLKYRQAHRFARDLPTITLNALEQLTLELPDMETIVQSLQAMDCKQINSLDLGPFCDDPVGDDIINAVCAFKSLVSLKMTYWSITKSQIQTLAQHLHDLTELGIRMKEDANVEDSIHSALSFFPKLKRLEIILETHNFSTFVTDVKQRISDFHARFAVFNTQIDLTDTADIVSTSKDRIYVCVDQFMELHWMDNLTEANVRKVMDGNVEHIFTNEVKFINRCSEAGLDICAFIEDFYGISSLDIESIGPISVKAHVNQMAHFIVR